MEPRTVDDARVLVDQYFGRLLESVARDSPVSQARLSHALAGVHLAAVRRRSLLRDRAERVPAAAGDSETVYELPEGLWAVLTNAQDASSLEARAAREVHRQMATALGADLDETAVALVYIRRQTRPP